MSDNQNNQGGAPAPAPAKPASPAVSAGALSGNPVMELTEEQRQMVSKMTGMEKAAVLMLSLNEEDAAEIFRHLEPKEVQRLGMEMASMSDFNHD